MKLSALVSGSAEVIGSEATLVDAAERMIERSVDALAVVSGREVAGLFTEHDLAESVAAGADLEHETVADWMTEAPDTFPPDMSVDEAVAWLMETGYRHLPVMGDDDLMGIVGIRDLVWALAQD
jgi:CBS domain-containing protein